MGEVKLMKGNEVLAEAAIRCGCDGYFGYPITPQSEVMETLMARQPWKTTGMVVLQAESEIASINMVYGAAATGKKIMTSSSSPGISLLAPSSVQEMNDFVGLGFDLACKYRNPAMILADGAIGQTMEKVELADYTPRWTQEEVVAKNGNWATTGKTASRKKNIITSLELGSAKMEANNLRFQKKYRQMEEEDVRYEAIQCDDADFILVAFGTSARVCMKVVEMARAKGLKVGLLRPITLFPFPKKAIKELAAKSSGFLSVEMNAGQMVEDIKLSVYEAGSNARVDFFGRMGGIIPTPTEVLAALEEKFSWELSYGVKRSY